jgi:hypothetical protein
VLYLTKTTDNFARGRRLQVFAAALILVVSLLLAFTYALVLLRSKRASYDDEGFMMMTLRQYMGGAPLYDRMYTEYGPFYYVFHSSLFALAGWSVNHDHIRAITLFFWVLVAIGWSACVWMWRRSVAWSLTTFLATVVVLSDLRWEPGHPQLLILLLLALIFVTIIIYTKTLRPVALATLGAAIAAVLLIKINIGGFVCAAILAVLTICSPPKSLLFRFNLAIRALCVAMPTVLMYRQFADPVVIAQCAVYTFGMWTVLDSVRRCSAVPEFDWPGVNWAIAGFFGLGCLTLFATLIHGTSLKGLLDGIILLPLRFSGAVRFAHSDDISIFIQLLHDAVLRPHRLIRDVSLLGKYDYDSMWHIAVLCSLASAGLWLYARWRSLENIHTRVQTAISMALILLAVRAPHMATTVAPSVMWTLVPGRAGEQSGSNRISILLLIVIATFCLLMAYPVFGTQASVAASIVLLACFAVLLHGIDDFVSAFKTARLHFAGSNALLLGLVLSVVLFAGAQQIREQSTIEQMSSAYLPNSRLIQLSTREYAVLSEINSGIAARCGALVTIPGMNSFHIWSGVPHPDGFLTSAAMTLFDEAAQERLRKDFLAAPHPCVIFNAELEGWSDQFHPSRPSQPFIDMVHHWLMTVYARDGYEIRVPPAEAAAW